LASIALLPTDPSIPPTATSEASRTPVFPPSSVSSTRLIERISPAAPRTVFPTDVISSSSLGLLSLTCMRRSKVADM
jgi:hypothetical protein